MYVLAPPPPPTKQINNIKKPEPGRFKESLEPFPARQELAPPPIYNANEQV